MEGIIFVPAEKAQDVFDALHLTFLAEKPDFCVVGIYLVSGLIDQSHVDTINLCVEVVCMGNCKICNHFVFFMI